MERLKIKHVDVLNALKTLEEILDEPFSIIVRDATIQRFEYTFEALWKFLKEYLKTKEGVISNTPKSCFRELFAAGIISENDSVMFFEMTDDRNMTPHTYKEAVSDVIYSKIKPYCILMDKLLSTIHL